MLTSSLLEGLVNYISSPGSSAFDRSLKLAETIAKNGEFCVQRMLPHVNVLLQHPWLFAPPSKQSQDLRTCHWKQVQLFFVSK